VVVWKTLLKKELEIKLAWRLKRGNALKRELTREGKNRWLDVGSSSNLDPDFHYLDWLAPRDISDIDRSRFYEASIVDLKDSDFARLGAFDLLRMQHVFEHFSFEDGLKVLNNCARLLTQGGYLLMTVPDLKLFIASYQKGNFTPIFAEFASRRCSTEAPASCYFSVYAHSFGYIPVEDEEHEHRDTHKWCYDFEGLKFQVERTGKFHKIRHLGLLHPLSYIPFTHNRPGEDVCLLAQKA
jgi:SAM-dependent methyltransferase